jgi:hypothetical protein
MKRTDPDIIAALRSIAAEGESQRVLAARKRHDERTQRRIETEMSLLSDEVEAVIPKDHPLFDTVLLLTVLRKVTKTEPEPQSALEFPNGW